MKTEADAIQRRDANYESAYIYRLPSELLNLIFTFLFLLGENALSPIRPNPTTTVHVTPILVVRWVSVWFRKVASQHTFWLDDELKVIDFLNNYDCPLYTFRLPSGYLEILLDDDDLCNWLQRRLWWNFARTNVIIGVSEKQPSFFRNARAIVLTYYRDEMPLHKLGLFVSLTVLYISPVDQLDLDAIATFCPLLQRLEILDMDQFEGSVAPLQNLTHLDIFMISHSDAPNSCPFSSLLPFHSANVLTRLELFIPEDSAISFDSFISNPFDAFVTLTDLTISTFHLKLYELVSSTRTTSIVTLDFKLDIDESDAEFAPSIIPEMLSANSLKNLRNLTIGGQLFPEDKFLEVYELLDLTTLARFQYLQYLNLDFPVPSSWWRDFENLRSLEFLRVCIDLGKYGMGGFDRDEIAVAGEKLIASIFANRDRKLHVVVQQWFKVWEPSVTIFDDWF